MAAEKQYRLTVLRWERSLVRTDLCDVLPALLWTTGVSLPGAKGRGGVTVLSFKHGIRAVARDYRRGGKLGNFQ